MKRKRSTQQAPSSPINQYKSEGQENKEEKICPLKKKRKEYDASDEMEGVEEERYSTPYLMETG
jgi:hypothetical protein